jgi:hypothetical protein
VQESNSETPGHSGHVRQHAHQTLTGCAVHREEGGTYWVAQKVTSGHSERAGVTSAERAGQAGR